MKQLVYFFIFCCITNAATAQQQRFSFTRPKMGSPFTIIFYHSDSAQAHQLADDCFNLVDSFVAIYSDYIDSSELNRLSRSSGQDTFVAVSPALFDILLLSQKAYWLSGKAFDISAGPLTRIWRRARKEKRFPAFAEIIEKKKAVGFDKVIIDTVSKTICLTQPGMQLDLGGIAQGYIAQKVLQRLQQARTMHALVDVSGDIAIGTAPPGKHGWTIGVNVPEQSEELLTTKLLLQNCAVSTSGDAHQYMEYNGKRYSHILDPRTGYGVTSQRNVTVMAKDAVTADWLATTSCILPIRKVKQLAKKVGAKVLIGVMKKGKLQIYYSAGFDARWQKQ